MSFMAKGKMTFVDGYILKTNSPSSLILSWKHYSNMVLSWLLNLLDKSLSSSIIYAKIVSSIWKNCKHVLLNSIVLACFNSKKMWSSITAYFNKKTLGWIRLLCYLTHMWLWCHEDNGRHFEVIATYWVFDGFKWKLLCIVNFYLWIHYLPYHVHTLWLYKKMVRRVKHYP